MNLLMRFARFWYDFIVGDDWTIAAAVVVALLITAALARAQMLAWWILPASILVFLAASLLRATRGS